MGLETCQNCFAKYALFNRVKPSFSTFHTDAVIVWFIHIMVRTIYVDAAVAFTLTRPVTLTLIVRSVDFIPCIG